MYIVGISAFGQNPAACIVKNGKLIAFAEEERFTRIKSSNGYFPGRALHYCLQEAHISLSNVHTIAVGWDHRKYRSFIPTCLLKSWWKYKQYKSDTALTVALHELLSQQPGIITKKIQHALYTQGHKKPYPTIQFISHHLAHAASSFYASGFKRSAIVVLDGSGEERATTWYTGESRSIHEHGHIDIPNSLGWFYAAFSAYLGFVPYEQDGYLMGLAPYGKPVSSIQKKINNILQIQNNKTYSLDPSYISLGKHTYSAHFTDKLVDLFGKPRQRKEPLTQKHKNIAYAVQKKLEDTVLELLSYIKQQTQTENLCLAGGVALNCKMNGRVLSSKLFKNIFVQPISHDAGSALGAAMVITNNKGNDPRFVMQHTYFGPKFSNSQIQKVLDNAQISYTIPVSITKTAAEAIAKGKIVAWFQGRMEAGPRALGNRSILANPSIRGIKDHINNTVKFRDSWRPFCPSLTKHAANTLFQSSRESQYMIVTHAPKKVGVIREATHIDKSTRPQVVTKTSNPLYYKLLFEVGKLTKTEAVLNTSFNVKGEPVVCTPQDALRCLYSTGIDVLAIGKYWIVKN